MKSSLISNLILLRAAVLFLGEKKVWWNSKFYEPISKDFLTYIFPKSKNTQFLLDVETGVYFLQGISGDKHTVIKFIVNN